MKISSYFQNAFLYWMRWIVQKIKLESNNKKFFLEYLAYAKKCTFGRNVQIYKHARVANSSIGDFTYVGKKCEINECEIGKFCSLGPEILIGLGIHPTDFKSTHPIFYSTMGQAGEVWVKENTFTEYKKTTIGNDVWIGARAIILPGITIGDGAIIAAGAVVSSDVEPYSITGGIPAKHIKYRFTEEKIRELLTEKWWEKDVAWMKENMVK